MLNNLINLVVGLFFLIGAIIALKNKNNKNLISYSVALAFIVLIILLVFDIIPETLELFNTNKYLYLISGTIIGFGLLLLLEKLVPHHDHYKEKNHNNHLSHIGTMTSIALIIHNLVEGMSIYGVAQNDIKAGMLYALAVGLHNIPFGIEITAMFKEKNNQKRMWIFLILLTLSTFLGGIIIHIFKGILSNNILGYLLSLTTGMIVYLIINELLIELKENFNKYAVYGLISGIILMLVGVIV